MSSADAEIEQRLVRARRDLMARDTEVTSMAHGASVASDG
jgi:hypothetical protein